MSVHKPDPEKEKIIDFKKLLAIMQKNFIVMTHDKIRFIPLLVFPIVMILVFGYISGNIPKHISTAIIVDDNSPISQEIQQEIANSAVFSVRYAVSTEGEAKKLLDSEKVRVIIEIPPNLQKDIDNNIQAGITVIVDESDSAIGATAKQTLNAIVNKVSSGIAMQKITSFQQSVGLAAQKLQNYNSFQINQYGFIAAKASASEASVIQFKIFMDDYSQALTASLGLPMLYAKSNTIMNDTNTYVLLPAGYTTRESQIAIFQQYSALAGSAAENIGAASMIARQADKQVKSVQSYEALQANVINPISTINVFTHSKAENIIMPLVYEEKPAYGTGKRGIDFVIPAIIALTIFQGAIMGMGRAIAGEKRDGSLTRVFLTPTSSATIVLGTLSFYALFEVFRSAFILLVSMLLFNIKIEGNLLLVGVIILVYASVSTSIGMIISSLVKTEQQFSAMAMIVSLPTMFLSGALFPLQAMPKFMQAIASFLPVTYGGDALRGVMTKGFSIGMIAYPLAILFIFLACLLGILFMVFKRDIE